MSDKKDYIKHFGPVKALDDDNVVKKLDSLKAIFNLSTDDLFVHWETFNVTKVQEDLDLNTENLDRLQQYVQEILSSSSKATPSVKKARDITSSRKPVIRSSAGFSSSPGVPSTPSLKRRKVGDNIDSSPGDYATANNTFQSPTPKTPGSKEVGSNTVLETLNPQIDELQGYIELEEDPATAIKLFKLGLNFDASKYKFRTMSMKLLESADVLDDQIDTVSQLFQENAKRDLITVEFGNPCLSSQFDIYVCGRIVPDSPLYDKEHTHTLNDTSLYLETSRFGGIGQRIPLDLSNLTEYSFFAGQIVVLKGRNPTGRKFIIQELLPLPSLGAPLSNKQELTEYQELTETSGLKILVAAGPFTNGHNLNYTKLSSLVDRINDQVKPHVVLLYGPFVDLSNQAVMKGDIELPNEKYQPRNLDEVFKKTVTPIIKKINPRIQVIMVPSLRDSAAMHASYPQDAFDRKAFGLPKNVKVFPNPSSFSVNEVLFGNSNLDIFKDLKDVYKGNSLNPNSQVLSNRFERISNHIFEQRRYYPVFPGSIRRTGGNSEGNGAKNALFDGLMGEELAETTVGGSALEMPYMGLTELGDSLPDILVAPSELKYFAKVIKGVVVINPGYFIKGNKDPNKEDGTYAVVSIRAPEVGEEGNVEPTEANPDLYFHNVYKRARVDILKV